jgi:hypothetical protein
MKLAHRHSTGTGLLFLQETKRLGRIADELARIAEEHVVLIVHETTEQGDNRTGFLEASEVTSGRRPSGSASPG